MSEELKRYLARRKVKKPIEEFIKVIDLCSEKRLCVDCPYKKMQPEECINLLLKDSRDLIIELHERQKAISEMVISVPIWR